jgi:hypothetical protein
MSGHLKCPHCASIVEYGVMVCRGCGAEVGYISGIERDGRRLMGSAFGGGFVGLVLFSAVWGEVGRSPSWLPWAFIGVGAVVGWRIAEKRLNGRTNQMVRFRRRYPDNRIVEFNVELPPFAAIAYSPSLRRSTYSHGYIDQASAEVAALHECGANDALVFSVRDAWCALAVADDGSYGYGCGITADQASKSALELCRRYTTTSAHLVLTISARQ